MTITEQKASDFTHIVYNLMRKELRDEKMETILREAAKQPAPRFYVSFENARRFVSLLVRGRNIPIVRSSTFAMYEELHRRYIDLKREYRLRGVRCPNYSILREIIDQPAPSFYTDVETLRCLFYKYLRKK